MCALFQKDDLASLYVLPGLEPDEVDAGCSGETFLVITVPLCCICSCSVVSIHQCLDQTTLRIEYLKEHASGF